MQIKAAIFDVDGILINSEGLQWQGWVEVLKPYGVELTKEKYTDYAGMSAVIIATNLKNDLKIKASIESLVDEKRRVIVEILKKGVELMPYVKEAIDFFNSRGIEVAIAGGGTRERNILKLEQAGLLDKFKIIASVDDEGVKNGKPNPDIYLSAAKKLGLKPEHCVAFEDTEYGMRAAKAAGMICIAIPTEWSFKQDFSQADAVVKNLKEAVEFVKKEYSLLPIRCK